MAHHPSAQKRARQTIKITARHQHVRTTTRSAIRKLRVAVAAGNRADAEVALKLAISTIDGAVAKGVYHRNTGSRYISRLTTQVAALK